jgi:ubiquinone/menaquinone biosynthesis C-methylase UbiE
MDKTKKMKSSMSGQDIPLIHRLWSLWKIFRAYQRGIFGEGEEEVTLHYRLIDVIKKNIERNIKGMKILEIGCGRTAVQTALFKADGANIIGVDMEVPTYKMNIKNFIVVLKTNGFERALKSLFRHILFDKRFFHNITAKYGKRLPLEKLDICVMNATNLAFDDSIFDFIFSVWTFEHIDDVHKALVEVNRVLKPSGIAYIAIHLFPSLSGGHHMDWIYPDKLPSAKVPPWDHCLDNKYPVNTYLNKLCLRDYRKMFRECLDVIDEVLTHEGEKYLTPELERKLNERGYSREDLISRTVTFLCRKKV